MGLPLAYRSKENARAIGGTIGKIYDREPTSGDHLALDFMHMRVDVDVENPITPGFFRKLINGKTVWVGFCYEKSNGMCYKCGRLGHSGKNYNEKKELMLKDKE